MSHKKNTKMIGNKNKKINRKSLNRDFANTLKFTYILAFLSLIRIGNVCFGVGVGVGVGIETTRTKEERF